VFRVVENQKITQDDILTSFIPVLQRSRTTYKENGVQMVNDKRHGQVDIEQTSTFYCGIAVVVLLLADLEGSSLGLLPCLNR
jgi:hypothetical protein